MSTITFTTGKIYYIDELYDFKDFSYNNNNNFIINRFDIFCSPIYNEYKNPFDLLEMMPKNSSFIEYEDSINKENIYSVKPISNDFINKTSPLVDNNFNGNEKLTVIGIKKSTNENSLFNRVNLEEKKVNNNRKIYNTKNMGRKKKGDILNCENTKIHNKMKPDNIRLKFKRGFINFLIDFINNLINNSSKLKRKRKIKKLNSVFVNNIKKDQNLKMLDLTVSEFLSREICEKCKIDKNHNIKVI